MKESYTLAAQLSTVHSSAETLEPAKVAGYLGRIIKEAPLDILAVGWTEMPELYRMLTSPDHRLSDEVFLWYPLLSDYPGFDPSHLVINLNAGKSKGWDGYGGTGIQESFKQACPNNPEAVETSLEHLEGILARYAFDGVFVDKIRFPSMVNGLQDVFSCFCPHCVRKAAEADLDLEEVKAVLRKSGRDSGGGARAALPEGAGWLEEMVTGSPCLQRFIRFRADSINRLVARVAERVRRMGRKTSFDVFTPALAPLVGQDLEFMAGYAAWIKPMIYRFGRGPSSLRSEIPAMIRELASYLHLEEEAVLRWAGSRIENLSGCTLKQLEEAAPLSLIRAEARRAVRLSADTPVYLGLETVSIPGTMVVEPRHVSEILEVGMEAGVRGFVLSWDLLHTPVANVVPLKKLKP